MTFIACAAAMLASTCMFTACKKDKMVEELQEEQGSYNGEVVKTQFAISLPNQVKAQGPNRMPGTTVQLTSGQFQGMTGITLIPFDVLNPTPTTIGASSTRLGTNIELTDIADASALGTNSNAKVYTNVSVPTSTSAFLFYATSKATGTKQQVGSLTANGLTSSTPEGISFTLEQIEPTIGAPTGTGTSGEALIAYLNSIANATDGSVAWKNYTNSESEAMTALFTKFKAWHSLSSTAVQNGLADLYTTLSAMSTTEPVTTLVSNLKAAIANATYTTVSGAGTDASPYVVALKSSPLDLTKFPSEYGLPEGSVRIKYVGDPSYEFQPCVEGDYTAKNNAPLNKYVYPASLWYFVNSEIRTSNYSQQALYNNTNDWNTILTAHGGEAYVNPSTHAVAIEDPIQYAVARLDVIVKLNATALEDARTPTANTINCASYQLTAVLVGGQKDVDYKFQPSGATEYTIYDNVMTGTINATTTNTDANSTLVMESEQGSTKDIQIAIELVNNSGHDFVGYEGEIIKAGAKFYLPATLPAASASVTSNKVFQQDYTTTATLTIKSLKNARNTIPDLRTPQLDLGMSVDLDWTAGNVYNIDIN